MTEKARSAAAVPFKARRRIFLANPEGQLSPRTEYEETSVSEVTDATLPGKVSKLQVITVRTVNRHWWVSR